MEVKEELKAKIDEEVAQILNQNILRLEETKVVYGSTQTKTAEGYAGNQLPEGYKFPTGGGFFYSDSGGPTASLAFSCPAPFNSFSIGVSLGSKSTFGQTITVPSTTKFYKLYVEKEVEGQQFIVYTRRDFTQPWTVFYPGSTNAVKNSTAYAKAV